ncbi:MAG: glycosyltransferase family 1 protein [Bacteroidetes bacterium]|nr:glycosyltransferase family 1 protein [Bacteroidota bacterium]
MLVKNKLRAAYFAGTMKHGQDGVTRVLYKMIEQLNTLGIENIFFSPIIPTKSEQPTKMFEVPSFTIPVYKEYKIAVPGYKNFEDKLREFNPDILHINSPCSLGYAAVKFGQKNNIPVVATYHTHFPSYAKYYKVKTFENLGWNYLKSLYNKCEAVFVPSKPIMEELGKHGLETIKYLPHGVDADIFNPSFKSLAWRESMGAKDKKIILYAGRLVWEKDLKVLADAYNIIDSQRDDAVFVLVGDGPVKEVLKTLMPKAIFLGYQSGEALSTAYASSDIFVFPSTTETFGNVTVEAMASGVPPVCVREGGAYGIIEEGITGLIAEPHNPKNFADKIIFLLDNEEKRIEFGLNAYKFSQTQSWDNIISKLIRNYETIIDSYRKAHSFRIIKAA